MVTGRLVPTNRLSRRLATCATDGKIFSGIGRLHGPIGLPRGLHMSALIVTYVRWSPGPRPAGSIQPRSQAETFSPVKLVKEFKKPRRSWGQIRLGFLACVGG